MSQRGSQTVNSVERKCVYCTSVSVWCVRAFAVRLREDLCVRVVWQSHGIGHNPCSCIYRVLHQVRSHFACSSRRRRVWADVLFL